jgi:hypothetical protein
MANKKKTKGPKKTAPKKATRVARAKPKAKPSPKPKARGKKLRAIAREVAGAVGGAIAGGVLGAIGGPAGVVVGATLGAATGAGAEKVTEGMLAKRRKRDEVLDGEIGVSGGELGAPNLAHPPARVGAYSTPSSGAGSVGRTPAEGPMENDDD